VEKQPLGDKTKTIQSARVAKESSRANTNVATGTAWKLGAKLMYVLDVTY
jgi:hypothetical protein